MEKIDILEVFSDGSGNTARIVTDLGLGIYMNIDDKSERLFSYRTKPKYLLKEFNFNKIHKVNSTIVEAYAVLLAIKEINNLNKSYSIDNKFLYTDSMTVYDILNDDDFYNRNTRSKRKNPLEYLLLKNIILEIKKIKNNIDIRWIKGHDNIFGNVIADKLAKLSTAKYFPTQSINSKKSDKLKIFETNYNLKIKKIDNNNRKIGYTIIGYEKLKPKKQ